MNASLSDSMDISNASAEVPTHVITSQPPSSFTCFSSLPAEIRFKIWKHALPGPRTIRMGLRYKEPEPVQEGEKRKPKLSRFVASCDPPINLRVCHESRVEALKKYELAFPTKWSPAQTYINFEIDTIVLDNKANYFPQTGRLHQSMKKNKAVILWREFDKIRFLAVDETFIWHDRLLAPANFPRLSLVSIIINRRPDADEKVRFYRLDACERPVSSTAYPLRSTWIKNWLDGMESLALKAGPGHKAPATTYVNMVYGTNRFEDAEEAAWEAANVGNGSTYGQRMMDDSTGNCMEVD